MKIGIVGSRNFKNESFVCNKVKKILLENRLITAEHELVSGGAKGVDSWAENTAKNIRAKCTIFKPDWDRYGKKAGFLRNIDIVKNSDKIIAFWDGSSKGTKHSIDIAISMKKPIDIYVRN